MLINVGYEFRFKIMLFSTISDVIIGGQANQRILRILYHSNSDGVSISLPITVFTTNPIKILSVSAAFLVH